MVLGVRGWRGLRGGVLIASALVQAACATLQPALPDSAYQTEVGRIAIVAVPTPPRLDFDGFAHGKGEGALQGAGGTFMSCVTGIGHGGCSGSGCGALLILLVGICGVSGIVGGVAGAVSAPDAATAIRMQAGMGAAADVVGIQEALRAEMVSAALLRGALIVDLPPGQAQAAALAQDYRPLAALGADAVLEVRVVRAGTEGAGIDDPVTAYMDVHARLVATADNVARFAGDFSHAGRRLPARGWAADEGARLRASFESAYAALAAHIYDTVFLLYRFPDRQPHGAGVLASAFGLAPLEPRTRGQLSGDAPWTRAFEWTTADGLRPLLRWEAFPRPGDVAGAAAEMGRLGKVSYDLIVASEANLAPAEIVYRRERLPRPEHRLESALQPGARYFWTVRARFELDGRERVTEWGVVHFAARERYTAPSVYSYRFRTP